MTRDAVIFFLRYPERGVKGTPLSDEIGDDMAYDLSICFIRDMLETARGVDAEPIIVGRGSRGKGPRGVFGKTLRLVQRGRDRGERLYHAFADVFSRGLSRAVLVGAGCPGLTADYIRQSFSELDAHDAVIGPCRSGGYCLIGCAAASLREEFFTDISWGTAKVLAETMGNIEGASMELSILSQLDNVTSLDDLGRMDKEGRLGKHSQRYVDENREKLFR